MCPTANQATIEQRATLTNLVAQLFDRGVRCDDAELISPYGPIGHSRLSIWLYEQAGQLASRKISRMGWKAVIGHNSWIDDTYFLRELFITTRGEIVESYEVKGVSPTWDLRIVGPHMSLSSEDVDALISLAKRKLTVRS